MSWMVVLGRALAAAGYGVHRVFERFSLAISEIIANSNHLI